jgi:hypothetical protein
MRCASALFAQTAKLVLPLEILCYRMYSVFERSKLQYSGLRVTVS